LTILILSSILDQVQEGATIASLPVFANASNVANSTAQRSTMNKKNGSFAIGDLSTFRAVRGLAIGRLVMNANTLTADQTSVIAALNATSSAAGTQTPRGPPCLLHFA
jgi:hypothetical protein